MRILLVAGNLHAVLQPQIEGVINARALTCEDVVRFIDDGIDSPDLLICTDTGIIGKLQNFVENIRRISEAIEAKGFLTKIIVATTNSEILSLSLPPQADVKYYFGGRVSFEDIRHIISRYAANTKTERDSHKNENWINKLFSNTESSQQSTGYSSTLSQGISRVIAVTGHRGSGVTGTVVNLAETAIKEGLSVIVVDLDIILRGVNMYYSSASAVDDENLNSSLVRLLAKPQNYDVCAYKAKPGLYISTIPYSFVEKQLLDKFFTAERIITMISVLKNKFNLCILDIPLEIAAEYNSVLTHIDTFGLCVNNTLYSVFNTVRNLDVNFSKEYRNLIAAKAKIIVTEYDDRIVYRDNNFTPNKVAEVLKTISNDFDTIGDPIGYIPYDIEFNRQIETEITAVNSNAKMKEAYKKILIKILEGVG